MEQQNNELRSVTGCEYFGVERPSSIRRRCHRCDDKNNCITLREKIPTDKKQPATEAKEKQRRKKPKKKAPILNRRKTPPKDKPVDDKTIKPVTEEKFLTKRKPLRRKGLDGEWIVDDESIPRSQKAFRVCAGPRNLNCKKCEELETCRKKGQLTYFSVMPHYIVDWMLDLSVSALKVFLYINRHVSFQKDDPYYNMTKLSNEQISQGTGVSKTNLDKYYRELKEKGYIRKVEILRTIDGKLITTNIFQTEWRIAADKLDVTFDKRGVLF